MRKKKNMSIYGGNGERRRELSEKGGKRERERGGREK